MQTDLTYAALDLGSNSFHMLVVRVEEQNYMAVIDNLKETVRLGAGLNKKDELTEEAQERALQCLKRFSQRLRGLHPEHIRIVGTNTLRRAKNAREFLQRVQSILPVPVNVLGGSEEARLIYLGVTHYLKRSEDRNFVIDIGGGSTELIVGKNVEPHTRESLPMGCVSWSLKYFPKGRISSKAFDDAVLAVGQRVEPYANLFRAQNWERAIGASGTIKAIAAMHKALGLAGDQITFAGMQQIRDRMLAAKSIDSADLPGLKEDRTPVIAGGFSILYGLFKNLGMEQMQVSPNALREGVLLDLLGRQVNQDKRIETVKRLQKFYGCDLKHASRIRRTAMHLFPQVLDQTLYSRGLAKEILGWAADLHEIGLAIAHHGYHKHGAYILLNGDLDGFSQTEQGLVSFLVLNHRKRLKTHQLPYENQFDWPLVFILRLAHILHRERRDSPVPDIKIQWRKRSIDLIVDPKWLRNQPLTRYDINLEINYWRRIGYKLVLPGNQVD